MGTRIESEAARWWNTERPLTHSLDSSEEGLAMKATQASTIIAEWRPAPGFEGVYEVCNLGQVRRIAPGPLTFPGKLLKPRPGKKGYLRVVLHYGPKHWEASVHRLVAMAFLGAPDNAQMQVNHIDGVTSNNIVTNLEWTTPSENMRHSATLGRRDTRGVRNGRAKLTVAQVREIRELQGSRIGRLVAAEYGISNSLVSAIWRRECWADIA